MDHSLGVGPKGSKPAYALTHHATEQPHHLEQQRLVKGSSEMATPEYKGHMARIKNRRR